MVLSEPVLPVPAAVPAPDPKKWWLTAEATTVKTTKTAKRRDAAAAGCLDRRNELPGADTDAEDGGG